MMTASTPGTNRPCTTRHPISVFRLVAVAAMNRGRAMANSAGTMMRFRPMLSASNPTAGATKATASVTTPTVRLTSTSEAWNRRWNSGSSGCVQ